MRDLKESHYIWLRKLTDVKGLVKIQLSDSLYNIHRCDICAYIDGFGDTVLKHLTKQVVCLPIYSIQNGNEINFPWLPPVGELSQVLFHLYYMDIFDTVFEKWYPGVLYSRCYNEVIIAFENDDFVCNLEGLHSLLSTNQLEGSVEYIDNINNGYLINHKNEKFIHLDDGRVVVRNLDGLLKFFIR